MKKHLYLILLVLFINSCAAPIKYTDHIIATPINLNEIKKTRISANADEWRNSGIIVDAGNKYSIRANGKWRVSGVCHYTNADGYGLYKEGCPYWTNHLTVVPGYSHSALIAKIGDQGQPFFIGKQQSFKAQSSGTLFFRINDSIGFAYDNEGEIYATIESVDSSAKTTAEQIEHALNKQKKVKTQVEAAIEEWQNSRIPVQSGREYLLVASGKWKINTRCQFTPANGKNLYNDKCKNNANLPPIVNTHNHATLIAKIGAYGKPFAVADSFKFRVADDGFLYLRINDFRGYTFDNEGFVQVSIQSLTASHTVDITKSSQSHKSIINKLPAQQQSQANLQKPDQNKTALIIGNSEYADSPLKNPANDASAMSEALSNLGFDVITLLNANQQAMEQAINQFSRKLMSDDRHVALLYYAGHGIQVEGENYLIPIQSNIARQSDVKYKAVNVGQILGMMGENPDNLNIIILDACRNNPLPRSFRSSHKGLARVEGPKGTIIGFATSPGSVASDGEGKNGLYTQHFLKNMKIPGLSIEEVFKKVLQGVHQQSKGQQTPWTESSFTGDFRFLVN